MQYEKSVLQKKFGLNRTVEVQPNQMFGQPLPFAQFLPTKTIKYDRIPSKASNIGKNRCQFPFQKYLCLRITPYFRRKIYNLIFGSILSHSDHSALSVTRAKRKEGSEAAQAGKEKQEGLLPRGSTNEKALC